MLDNESLYELTSIAALVHAKRDLRNWCWGGGKEALFKGELSGRTPKNWNLWIKVNNDNGRGLDHVNIQVERKRSSLHDKDEFQVLYIYNAYLFSR